MCSSRSSRQQEREVGDGAAGDRPLLAVVDALEQPGEAQDVVGHALAPLAPRLRAGERLPQRLGGAGQLGRRPQRVAQTLHQLAVLCGTITLEAADQVADPRQLVAHRREPLPDGVSM